MGYQRKTYELTWPAGHELHGLEVVTRGLPTRKLFELAGLAQRLQHGSSIEEQVDAAEKLFAGFAERLVSWNLEDDDGQPVPATADGVAEQDFDLLLGVVMAWMDAVASVDIPLPGASPDGATTETTPNGLGSIPVETLSSSLLS